MGLTPHEYYCMSPLEFNYALRGYNDKQLETWQQTRILAYQTEKTIPRRKGDPKLKPIKKWFPLTGDQETVSEDRIKKMLNLAKKKLEKDG